MDEFKEKTKGQKKYVKRTLKTFCVRLNLHKASRNEFVKRTKAMKVSGKNLFIFTKSCGIKKSLIKGEERKV